MKDKCLSKEGITEKYDCRGNIIDYLKITGTVGGGVYALLNIGKVNSLREVLIGGGFGIFSYFLGNYIYKRNENKKKESINNIEARLLAEGRR
jgi:hypothetical protein